MHILDIGFKINVAKSFDVHLTVKDSLENSQTLTVINFFSFTNGNQRQKLPVKLSELLRKKNEKHCLKRFTMSNLFRSTNSLLTSISQWL